MKGYTLIELLIIIAVLTVILVISAATFYNLTEKSDLDVSRDNIVSILNTARNKTLASEGSAQYGVYFDTSSSPDRYILRNTSFEEIHNLPSSVEISNISFNGGGSEVIFKLLNGNTDNHGSLTIRSLTTNKTQAIYIYPSGEISAQPESFPGPGARITDSRHVHFTYTRNINTATEIITLTFTDPTTTANIPMDDHTTSVSFDWEDDIDVGGDVEHIRIHTHRLNDITLGTQFCIHRDKRYNNKALDIDISEDIFPTPNLIHFDADGTIIKGNSSDVINLEKQ